MNLKNALIVVIILLLAVLMLAREEGEPMSLGLADCIGLAVKENLGLRVEQLGYQVSRWDLVSNRGLFAPVFSLWYNHDQTRSPSASLLEGADVTEGQSDVLGVTLDQALPLGGQVEFYFGESRYETNSTFYNLNPRFDARLQIEVVQPLLRDFGDRVARRDILAARYRQDSRYQSLKEALQELVYRVENAYWDLVYSRMNLEVKQESVQAARRLLAINRKKLQAGTIPELEILTARSQVATRESEIIQARANIRDAEDTLADLLNVQLNTGGSEDRIVPRDVPASFSSYEPPALSVVLDRIRREDPRILRLKAELENRGLDVRYYQNQILPELDVIARLWTTGLSGDEIIFEDNDVFNRVPVDIIRRDMWLSIRDALKGIYNNWSVSLNLQLPLFNAAARADLRKARLEFQQARLSLLDAQRVVIRNLQSSRRGILTNREKLLAYVAASKLARAQLEAEEKKFKAGVSTNYQVLKAQENYEENRSAEVQAAIDLRKAIILFQKNTGSLLEEKGIVCTPGGKIRPEEVGQRQSE